MGDDRVNVQVSDITYAKYNGPYPTGIQGETRARVNSLVWKLKIFGIEIFDIYLTKSVEYKYTVGNIVRKHAYGP